MIAEPAVPAMVIAGTHSGSGKTTVTLAVLAALVRRGLRVQGFKVGPDFIDPGHHARVTGRSARNLDTWLLGSRRPVGDLPPRDGRRRPRGDRRRDGAVRRPWRARRGGLDGRSRAALRGAGRARRRRPGAQPARSPRRCSGSFRSTRRFAWPASWPTGSGRTGIITDYLTPALVERLPEVAALGYLARDQRLAIPSRHLGLLTSDEHAVGAEFWDVLADAAEASLDLDRLVALARPPRLEEPIPVMEAAAPRRRVRVALARDPAFCFYYEDNLDLLRAEGAEIITFSPLADLALPEGVELVYLGGGYPEVFAARLAANEPMRRSLRRFHARGERSSPSAAA